MKANGAGVIHLATGLIVGYPPCPYLIYFHDYIEKKYGLEVVYGTHPIPQKYLDVHERLGTWECSFKDKNLGITRMEGIHSANDGR